MTMKTLAKGRWVAIAMWWMTGVVVGSAFCTPSGLNNIPTADVVDTGFLVLQQMNNLRAGGWHGRHVLAFKYGIASNMEVGWVGAPTHSGSKRDFLLGVGAAAGYPMTFHGKVRFALGENGLKLGVGIVNLSDSARKAGNPVYYAVLSQDLKWVRGHLGFMTTRGPDGLFVGIDKRIGRWTWRVDFNDVGEGSVYTFGFLHSLSCDWILEGWISFPTARGVRETLTLKLNYVVKLR